jgi:hypothetical protein
LEFILAWDRWRQSQDDWRRAIDDPRTRSADTPSPRVFLALVDDWADLATEVNAAALRGGLILSLHRRVTAEATSCLEKAAAVVWKWFLVEWLLLQCRGPDSS